ncbi:nucleoside diphospahte hydrolase, putative [Perkinsus marinus ATCC 50983]|uniref:Nucleoside diphospahte hydrolase, putative n=1 Tax=Perkinsus marinus (strain ATCC 50983 / TXsc) TaxID=423536 RepID=C5K7Q5_PERM5|nr:nucleoside diphospahte hydrolase, putative [Perkinsus marinus ATCC 50983]EER19590.1 nucleoside diphospahte hydrolase, putative [Perkinsus marinus ATCC 50983]|eukprot:XP_002787794.1 nucleoside diphospahte hydrolase, putative [Perkinsus marinus ATCC 50983]
MPITFCRIHVVNVHACSCIPKSGVRGVLDELVELGAIDLTATGDRWLDELQAKEQKDFELQKELGENNWMVSRVALVYQDQVQRTTGDRDITHVLKVPAPRDAIITWWINLHKEMGRPFTHNNNALNADEVVPVYSPEGQCIGAVVRWTITYHKSFRCTYLVIRNKPTGKYYVQQRTDIKDYMPGRWDPVPGGTMGVGETPEVNAHRELKEEMGIDIAEGDFKKLFVQVSHEAPLRVFGHVFLCETDLPVESLKLQECEVKQCKLMTEDEIMAMDTSEVVPDSMVVFRRYLQQQQQESS